MAKKTVERAGQRSTETGNSSCMKNKNEKMRVHGFARKVCSRQIEIGFSSTGENIRAEKEIQKR